MTIAINTSRAVFEIKVNGETCIVDFSKMHESWVEYYLLKAAQRRLNDDMSGLDPEAKLAETRRMLAIIHSGDAMPEKERAARGMGVSADPVTDLARKNAKADLTAAFKKLTSASKIEDMVAHEKVKPYFKAAGDKYVWDDSAVTVWMDKRKVAGKDYMAEAEAMLGGDVDI